MNWEREEQQPELFRRNMARKVSTCFGICLTTRANENGEMEMSEKASVGLLVLKNDR